MAMIIEAQEAATGGGMQFTRVECPCARSLAVKPLDMVGSPHVHGNHTASQEHADSLRRGGSPSLALAKCRPPLVVDLAATPAANGPLLAGASRELERPRTGEQQQQQMRKLYRHCPRLQLGPSPLQCKTNAKHWGMPWEEEEHI
ncbi:unnamed protein product [Lampetra fluviatilis]